MVDGNRRSTTDRCFAGLGLPVAIADLPDGRLQAAETGIKDAWGRASAVAADMARAR